MLFPTSLVGSYPQPYWLIDRDRLKDRFPPRVRARELWRIGDDLLEEALDDATTLAVQAQLSAGLDIFTDGEARRESYSNHFATALEGVDIDNPGVALDRSGEPNPVPRVAGPIRRRAAVAARDAAFLRGHTDKPIKVTIPGPFTMAQQAQNDHYSDERSLALAYAAAVNEEVHETFAAGADIVQLDEPYMQARAAKAQEYGVEVLSRALEGAPGRPRCTSASATPRSSTTDRTPTPSFRSWRTPPLTRSPSRPRSPASTARSWSACPARPSSSACWTSPIRSWRSRGPSSTGRSGRWPTSRRRTSCSPPTAG
nr:hypothetical protein [Allosalinactinospora lopnorensis]